MTWDKKPSGGWTVQFGGIGGPPAAREEKGSASSIIGHMLSIRSTVVYLLYGVWGMGRWAVKSNRAKPFNLSLLLGEVDSRTNIAGEHQEGLTGCKPWAGG